MSQVVGLAGRLVVRLGSAAFHGLMAGHCFGSIALLAMTQLVPGIWSVPGCPRMRHHDGKVLGSGGNGVVSSIEVLGNGGYDIGLQTCSWLLHSSYRWVGCPFPILLGGHLWSL